MGRGEAVLQGNAKFQERGFTRRRYRETPKYSRNAATASEAVRRGESIGTSRNVVQQCWRKDDSQDARPDILPAALPAHVPQARRRKRFGVSVGLGTGLRQLASCPRPQTAANYSFTLHAVRSLDSATESHVQGFRYEEETENGVVRIRPAETGDLEDLTSLLVQTFSKALGYSGTFKWFLRKEVRWYLEDCLKLGSTGVVLVATLESSPDETEPLSASSSYTRPMFRSFRPEIDGAIEEVSDLEPQGQVTPAVEKTVSSVFRDFRSEIDDETQLPVKPEPDLRPTEKEERALPPQAPDMETPPSIEQQEGSAVVESEVEEESSDLNEDPGRPRNALILIHGWKLEEACFLGEVLVGTLELSLSPSSRSYYFLLDPPSSAAYICNMAVHADFRRQGHASRLLKAAEQIVQDSQMNDIYLHLLYLHSSSSSKNENHMWLCRVEDNVAGSLYKKFGYTVEKTNPGFVRLLGQDRKHLLRKTIAITQ